jgi:hypothetical protein
LNAPRFAGPALVVAFAAFAAALVASSWTGRGQGNVRKPAKAEEALPSGRTLGEERAVAAAAVAGLRPATDDDAADSEAREELRALYGDYQPYFVRGDFDSDGRLDFAQAFVRRDGPEPLFDVAVFFGSDSGFAAPVWVDRGAPLAAGDLSIDRSVLVVTDDVEREIFRRWRWDSDAARFVDVDEGDGEEGAEPWTEPDTRLGTTA